MRLISEDLEDPAWADLAAHEGLTPDEGYVDWNIDDYSELGNEVYDYLGSEGTLILNWEADPKGVLIPGDLWFQVKQLVDDLMSDWLSAIFELTLVTDEREIKIYFRAVD